MKALSLVRIAALAACLAPTSGYAAALEVASLTKPPTIDGNIGESEWAEAHIADQNFVQIEPAYGAPSPFRTVVRVAKPQRLSM